MKKSPIEMATIKERSIYGLADRIYSINKKTASGMNPTTTWAKK